ncbi:MAG: hypothetical protein QOF12_1189 [Solirubrobacteraceae bacterium]|jgi:hypothetical protein|nr:hypothetical protein [Solirubrobacteraceae bacterium]
MRIATLLTCLTLLCLPAAAGAQSPLGPLPSAPTTGTPTVVVSPPTTSSGGGLQTWQEILIFGAGLILLFGIGWAIVSDARSRAPVSDAELAHPGMGGPTRSNRSAKQRERARAKAKKGRVQRKRNRSRRR